MHLINKDSFLQHKKWPHKIDGLIPFLGYQTELLRELRLLSVNIYFQSERLIICDPINKKPIWAQDHWPDIHFIDDSNEAVQILKSQKNIGYYYFHEKNLLASKISQRIKVIPEKRIEYNLSKDFNFKFYVWTVIGQQVIFCLNPHSKYPCGWNEFIEDKSTPPNRAYLKLWEVFQVHKIIPQPSDSAIEIGASPGGWSWVLSHLMKNVYTIDRAPLDKKISALSNVHHQLGDAFKIDPNNYEDCTWFFSDIICTPEKIYETIQFWLDQSRVENFVCTIKFKGECNYEIIDKLRKIPHSKIVRLYQNKNEVTWLRCPRLLE